MVEKTGKFYVIVIIWSLYNSSQQRCKNHALVQYALAMSVIGFKTRHAPHYTSRHGGWVVHHSWHILWAGQVAEQGGSHCVLGWLKGWQVVKRWHSRAAPRGTLFIKDEGSCRRCLKASVLQYVLSSSASAEQWPLCAASAKYTYRELESWAPSFSSRNCWIATTTAERPSGGGRSGWRKLPDFCMICCNSRKSKSSWLLDI